MNANYQPKTPAIKDWLKTSINQLKESGFDTPSLDTEVILAHTIKKGRTYLHAHGDDVLDIKSLEIADARLALRLDHVPIAYIIGHKEFYGRKFKVTTATLIPRPESEVIIDLLKELTATQTLFVENTKRLVDVGTGSGCLGITAKLEFPELDVTLLDISSQALMVAKQNARLLDAQVTLLKSDLLTDYDFQPDIILANLPYVDKTWDRSPETNHEPEISLFALQDGLAIINKLIIQASLKLGTGGVILLEADTRQHKKIIEFASHNGFELIKAKGLCIALKL